MARRTLWEVANDADAPVPQAFAAIIMLFIAEIAAILAIIWVAIWLLGLIATICPIIGLYHAVTKEPTR